MRGIGSPPPNWLAKIAIEETADCLGHEESTVRMRGLTLIRHILTCHSYDVRYQDRASRQRVAGMYSPFIQTVVQHVKRLSELSPYNKERKEFISIFLYLLQDCPPSLLKQIFRDMCRPQFFRKRPVSMGFKKTGSSGLGLSGIGGSHNTKRNIMAPELAPDSQQGGGGDSMDLQISRVTHLFHLILDTTEFPLLATSVTAQKHQDNSSSKTSSSSQKTDESKTGSEESKTTTTRPRKKKKKKKLIIPKDPTVLLIPNFRFPGEGDEEEEDGGMSGTGTWRKGGPTGTDALNKLEEMMKEKKSRGKRRGRGGGSSGGGGARSRLNKGERKWRSRVGTMKKGSSTGSSSSSMGTLVKRVNNEISHSAVMTACRWVSHESTNIVLRSLMLLVDICPQTFLEKEDTPSRGGGLSSSSSSTQSSVSMSSYTSTMGTSSVFRPGIGGSSFANSTSRRSLEALIGGESDLEMLSASSDSKAQAYFDNFMTQSLKILLQILHGRFSDLSIIRAFTAAKVFLYQILDYYIMSFFFE